MNDKLANDTIRRYVCSRCWGRLDICFIDGEYLVKCMNPDCNGDGFVTKYYANKRRQESANERLEVREYMQDMGVVENPDAGKSNEQLLKELGV